MSEVMNMPLTSQVMDNTTMNIQDKNTGLYDLISNAISKQRKFNDYKQQQLSLYYNMNDVPYEYNEDELDSLIRLGLDAVIDAGADVNARFKFEQTALMYASQGSLFAARLLIERGADVNAIGNFGSNALFTAIGNMQNKIVELLIQNGANTCSESTSTLNNGRFNSSPIVYAVAVDNLTAVKLLLDNGVEVNTIDEDGRTPLGVATSLGLCDIKQLLIERGATIPVQTENA
jgi:ankyrin repeat protein